MSTDLELVELEAPSDEQFEAAVMQLRSDVPDADNVTNDELLKSILCVIAWLCPRLDRGESPAELRAVLSTKGVSSDLITTLLEKAQGSVVKIPDFSPSPKLRAAARWWWGAVFVALMVLLVHVLWDASKTFR